MLNIIFTWFILSVCYVLVGNFKMADNELGVVKLGMPGM